MIIMKYRMPVLYETDQITNKITKTLTLLIFTIRISYAQTDTICTLNSYMSTNPKQDIETTVVEDVDFLEMAKTNEPILSYAPISNTDSLEKILLEHYSFIEKSNDTLRFTCKNKTYQVWNKTGNDSKENRNYKLMGLYNKKYLFVRDLAYEYSGALLIDLDNQYGFQLPAKPIVQSSNYIYSGENIYGDYDISIYEKNGTLVLALTFNNAEIDNYFIRNDYLYFTIKSACDKRGLKEFYKIELPAKGQQPLSE